MPQAMDLDPETLQLVLNAARVSSLAYRTPIQVEYLRLRANKKTQEEALQVIKRQVGGDRAMCRHEKGNSVQTCRGQQWESGAEVYCRVQGEALEFFKGQEDIMQR
jgi:hypothetical protein